MGVPFKRFRPGHRPVENYCRFRHLFHSCASLSGAAFYFSIFCTIHDSLSLRTEQLQLDIERRFENARAAAGAVGAATESSVGIFDADMQGPKEVQ